MAARGWNLILTARDAERLRSVRNELAAVTHVAALAGDVTLALLLSRGPVLDFDVVRRLCLVISQKGQGVIDISTYLSPNSVLLMGQNGTLRLLDARIHEVFPHQVAVRSLAFKWLRIIYRCWKDGKPYDEAIYMQSLRRRGCLLAGVLGTPTGVRWKSVAGFQKLSEDNA